MGFVDSFLAQECTWSIPAGYAIDGTPTLEAAGTIPCRWVRKSRQTTDKAGNIVVTEYDVLVNVAVNIGDRFANDGVTVEVVSLKDYVGFSGSLEGVRASCRRLP